MSKLAELPDSLAFAVKQHVGSPNFHPLGFAQILETVGDVAKYLEKYGKRDKMLSEELRAICKLMREHYVRIKMEWFAHRDDLDDYERDDEEEDDEYV